MNETETLTQKQDSFAVHYTTIGAETFGNGTKSAIAAGYSEKGAYARGSELLRNRKVIDRISELHKENMQRNMITVDKVLADLEHETVVLLLRLLEAAGVELLAAGELLVGPEQPELLE